MEEKIKHECKNVKKTNNQIPKKSKLKDSEGSQEQKINKWRSVYKQHYKEKTI